MAASLSELEMLDSRATFKGIAGSLSGVSRDARGGERTGPLPWVVGPSCRAHAWPCGDKAAAHPWRP
jgi:hypothetical protein